MKRMLFVMNPYAGMRRGERYLAQMLGIFNRAGVETTVHITAGPGEATRVVRERAGDMDVVVCCGGDGTFNETIAGILEGGWDVPVGYIPAGSTNDFAASLGISSNMLTAAEDILLGEPVAYDMGRFGNRYFSYVASFGAFTRTSYTTPQSIKNALGHTAYLLAGIQELSQIHKEHVRMELDGMVVEDDFLFGAISNATSVGGVLNLDPSTVDLQDGKLEVLLFRAPEDLMEIPDCLRAVQSQKYDCDMIIFRSASHIRVYADPAMPWTLDGEREEGHECIEVENIHRAVRIIQRRKKGI